MNKHATRAATEIRTVEARSLRIHPTAQRELTPSKVAKFVRTLDLDALGAFHAVEYAVGGVYALWVIDGHHRLAALTETGMGEWMVDVIVHTSVRTDSRASDLFLKLNDRSQARPFDTFRNELQAGYVHAVAISSIAERHGLRVEDATADGSLRCVASLKRSYGVDAGRSLDAALGTLVDSWGRVGPAFEGRLIEGFTRFGAVYGAEIDRPSLATRLKKFPGGPLALLGRAKGLAQLSGRPLAKCVGEVIVEVYDKGRTTRRLGDGAL